MDPFFWSSQCNADLSSWTCDLYISLTSRNSTRWSKQICLLAFFFDASTCTKKTTNGGFMKNLSTAAAVVILLVIVAAG